jgi:hypothetical protein
MWLLAYAGTTAPSEHAAPSTDATMHGFFSLWQQVEGDVRHLLCT